ncbi:hypothetical protein TNCV_396381 [Trichonephila clavipes]|nr:hypothetical protein TNCV_396381 [Trichonephila clavipes]
MEHKTSFIGKGYLAPLGGCPVAVLACKFQPSLQMNSSQHRCMNQASTSEVQTQQRSFNRSLEDTVDSPLAHVGGLFLYGSMAIGPNTSPQPSFISDIYGSWCTTFATSVILERPILPCMAYSYYGGTLTVHKLSRFGNASTLGPKANDHDLLDVG